jgi:diadenosine tetraphosphate (Ap4A) HIT family hydrolase
MRVVNCIFCQISLKKEQSEIIREFKYCFVLFDRFPVTKGHLLIVSKKHLEHWFLAPKVVKNDIIQATDEMKLWLDETYCPDGYNLGINCGVVAGEEIMHLHVHLIPRYKGDMDNPRGGVRGVIPEKQKDYNVSK